MQNIVCVSGGKDSTALALHCIERGLENLVFVYNDTKWEWEGTYKYLEYLNERVLGGRLLVLESEGMVALAARKKRFPSSQARFCTEALKIKPLVTYLQSLEEEYEVWIGKRRDESRARANTQFREWSDTYDCWVNNPLADWPVEKVFEIHAKYGVDPNPLYKIGMRRVGCFPCINSGLKELKAILTYHPERFDELEQYEADLGRSFWGPGTIPDWACSNTDTNGAKYPSVSDVRRYLSDNPNALNLFDVQPPACMSVYGLCDNPI